MNRKLHNTASALFASAGLLVLGLIAASPMPLAGFGADADAALAAIEAAPADAPDSSALQVEIDAARMERALAAGGQVADVAALVAEATTLAVMSETLDALEAADAPPRSTSPQRKPRRSRQSVAMPFFSFAPRG